MKKINSKSLYKKVAVITGSSSGIGKAIAIKFAEQGATVIISSRNIERCRLVEDEIHRIGGKADSFVCDVRIESDIINLFSSISKKYKKIDIVIANSGICGGSKSFADYTIQEWNRVMDTNLTGVFLTIREAFRLMKNNFSGHILIIASLAGTVGYALKGPYCASKFGVRGLAQSLQEECRDYNINVSTISPGSVDTPILKASNTKVKKPMTTDVVANAAVYLASLSDNTMIRDLILERINAD